jgi:hypothetical protein
MLSSHEQVAALSRIAGSRRNYGPEAEVNNAGNLNISFDAGGSDLTRRLPVGKVDRARRNKKRPAEPGAFRKKVARLRRRYATFSFSSFSFAFMRQS